MSPLCFILSVVLLVMGGWLLLGDGGTRDDEMKGCLFLIASGVFANAGALLV